MRSIQPFSGCMTSGGWCSAVARTACAMSPSACPSPRVAHAAYKLPKKEGIAKLKQHAKWLQQHYPDAAASLLEGLEETFTVNRLKLTPALMRCLCTTNIIENPNGAVRRVTGRICR